MKTMLILIRIPDRPVVLHKVVLLGDGGYPIDAFIMDHERINTESGTIIGALPDIVGSPCK